MAIVLYKCDTCKRTKEIGRNINGLETIGRCSITHGCRGKLYQEKLLQDYLRGSIPKDVAGLNHWVQRKVIHDHQQPIASDIWNVRHDMGVLPSAVVYVSRPVEGNPDYVEKIEPESVRVVDNNTVNLVFDRPYSGHAQMFSNQSDPGRTTDTKIVKNENSVIQIENKIKKITETIVPRQISNMGEITIATRVTTFDNVNEVAIRVAYVTTNGGTPITEYIADNQPSVYSAWSAEDLVYIKGEVYAVRSFNGITNEMYNGVINTGSTFMFHSIDPLDGSGFRPLERDDAFILLAYPPFETVDKIKNHVIDLTAVTDTKNTFDFYFADGEFFANSNVMESVYPSISINQ